MRKRSIQQDYNMAVSPQERDEDDQEIYQSLQRAVARGVEGRKLDKAYYRIASSVKARRLHNKNKVVDSESGPRNVFADYPANISEDDRASDDAVIQKKVDAAIAGGAFGGDRQKAYNSISFVVMRRRLARQCVPGYSN